MFTLWLVQCRDFNQVELKLKARFGHRVKASKSGLHFENIHPIPTHQPFHRSFTAWDLPVADLPVNHSLTSGYRLCLSGVRLPGWRLRPRAVRAGLRYAQTWKSVGDKQVRHRIISIMSEWNYWGSWLQSYKSHRPLFFSFYSRRLYLFMANSALDVVHTFCSGSLWRRIMSVGYFPETFLSAPPFMSKSSKIAVKISAEWENIWNF